MVNYGNGKIYKIEPIVCHEEGEVYIGSTTKKYLSQRMDDHRSKYKAYLRGEQHLYTCFDIFDKYGVDNCQIVLIENVNAKTKTKDELLMKEKFHINSNLCVNKKCPILTKNEKTQYNKEYRSSNKARISTYHRDYGKKNKTRIIHRIYLRYRRKQSELLYNNIRTFITSSNSHHLLNTISKLFRSSDKFNQKENNKILSRTI